MPDTITCTGPGCQAAIDVSDRKVGDLVPCPKCGRENTVLVPVAEDFEVEELKVEGEKMHHPARLTCTNCGAVLGVRDAICKHCGGDVRSGITVLVSKEEKQRRGLFFLPIGGRKKRARRRSGGALVAVAVALLIVAGAVAAVYVLPMVRGTGTGAEASVGPPPQVPPPGVRHGPPPGIVPGSRPGGAG